MAGVCPSRRCSQRLRLSDVRIQRDAILRSPLTAHWSPEVPDEAVAPTVMRPVALLADCARFAESDAVIVYSSQ